VSDKRDDAGQDFPTQAGPCAICGATDYSLSMGGPTICPACDCGPPNPKQVREERECLLSALAARDKENERLRAHERELLAALRRSKEAYAECLGENEEDAPPCVGHLAYEEAEAERDALKRQLAERDEWWLRSLRESIVRNLTGTTVQNMNSLLAEITHVSEESHD